MSLFRTSLLVLCAAVVLLGAIQAQSSAALLGEWKLDEPGDPTNGNMVAYGDTCFDTLGLHNLKYENAYGYNPGVFPTSTTGRWGPTSKAMHFGGPYGVATTSPGYGAGDASNWLAYNRTNYTVEGFFMRDGTTTEQEFFYSEAGWGGPYMFLGVQNNEVSFGAIDTDKWNQMTGTTQLVAGQWYYTAAVVTNSVPTLYLYDGTSMQSWTGAAIGTQRTSTDGFYLTVGAGISRANWCFLGAVDNVAVYDTALDAATLLAHATTNPVVTYLPGDADRNGTVDGADLNTVLSNYNQTFTVDPWSMGDFDGNGTVDGADLNVVLSNYNQHSNAAGAPGTPEPSTLLLAAAGLVGLLAYAWKKRK
jgi:hypothetical protein